MEDYRNFEVASEATEERYKVEFRWLQTAISLRHSDTVDVKFLVNGQGKIVALPHAALEEVCRKASKPLKDGFCARIAARHLEEALRTDWDAEMDLLTLTPARVAELAEQQWRGSGRG
ncbi:MAG: hypothetical protein HY236_16250 [Acidobacteria bacterium]|nr:hypothetical protein [Acidobacteriota bacterium]